MDEMDTMYGERLYNRMLAKLAPDIRRELSDTSTVSYAIGGQSIRVSLQAEAYILHKHGLSSYTLRGSVNLDEGNLMAEAHFSEEEISNPRDAAIVVGHIFDNLKRRFIEELAKHQLDRLEAFQGRNTKS